LGNFEVRSGRNFLGTKNDRLQRESPLIRNGQVDLRYEQYAIERQVLQTKFGRKTIGILGGMGPPSTADFYMRIVTFFQREFGAKYDKDFPPMLIFSVPIPDVVETVENEAVTLSYLVDAARTLETGGADFISIPCNTVHWLLGGIRSSVKIPVLSIVEATAAEISGRHSRVGLLATQTTIKMKIYDDEFRRREIELVLPSESDQTILTEIIMDLGGGIAGDSDRVRLRKIVENLEVRGAEAVVLACTELPLLAESNYGVEIVDPNEILARSCARFAMT